MADHNIDSAIELLDKITEEDIVTVKFRKKDTNEERIMRCTLNFDRIPDRDKPKSVSLKKILKLIKELGILHVYDLDKMGWRSIPFERTEWMETPKIKYKIRR